MNADYTFRLVKPDEASTALALYHSLIGTPGCAWSEEYPSIEDIQSDIEDGSLYCLCGADGQIVALAAAGRGHELGSIAWDVRIQIPCELARLGVHPRMQRRGLGALILKRVIAQAQRRGFDGMCMLVSKTNPAALALYEKAGFRRCGQAFVYGMEWFCYELAFCDVRERFPAPLDRA